MKVIDICLGEIPYGIIKITYNDEIIIEGSAPLNIQTSSLAITLQY